MRNVPGGPNVFSFPMKKSHSGNPRSSASFTRRNFIGSLAAGAMTAALASRVRAQESGERKLGVALVGLGGYSRGQLGPALKQTQHCRLMGVVTGSPEKGAQWAKDYGFPEKNIYGYENMAQLADNRDIDIVYVVTPNALHKEHAIAAAKAGKHVICEKPFTNTAAEAEDVLKVFRAQKIKHAIGYRLHYEPRHQEFMRLAKEKDFGTFTKADGGFSFVMNTTTKPWRAQKDLAGGGPVMDLGVYFIQAACMAGEGKAPIAVWATEGEKQKPEYFTDVEETMNMKFEFANGLIAEGSTSYNAMLNRIRAEGDKGWIQIQPAYSYGGLRAETSKGPLDYPRVNQQALQMDDFALCVKEGRDSRVPGEMGLRDNKIIDAIYESARNGGKKVELKA